MANKIIMPKLSPTMEEGQISRWLKKEGDEIEANEPIAEVDTDKATMEVTSLDAGTLLKIVISDGKNARLGETIGVIGEKGEDFSALVKDDSANGTSSKPAASGQPKNEAKSAESSRPNMAGPETEGKSSGYQPAAPIKASVAVPASATSEPKTENGRMLVSPIAARMATENGIDLHNVSGSGPQGRIIKRDIESALATAATSDSAFNSFEPSVRHGASAFREENTSQMRRVIAQRLGASIGPIPTFYLNVEIEMDNALALRKQINSIVGDTEKVSVNDIIVKIAAQSLLKHPFVNSSYQDKSIRFYEDADIGVAVAIEDGLITPVVRAANRKGVVQISREIREMAARARDKKLQSDEYTGATFSISNLGMFGIEQFTAIINPPEAAILAVGTAAQKPVVRDGSVVVRSVMNVTMSCDHRVVDGATGAKFLQTFKQMVENPGLLLM
jgi:pyruvate dehydrogenase E2 component (dihydrolipoamide acetyltransferase)